MEVANFKRNILECFYSEHRIRHLDLPNHVAFSTYNSYGLHDARSIFFRRHAICIFKGEMTINFLLLLYVSLSLF
jgi:hypothetical protein